MIVSHRLHSAPEPAAVIELLKPVTWFPPMWAFACGVASTGIAPGDRWGVVLLGVAVAGPLVCAASQAVNDWFDREVDAINEPGRPIPSGRMPGRWGLRVALAWTAASALAGWFLGPWGFAATLAALALAWAYSAPPLRLKENGWWGNTAVAFSYEGLAWVTGATVVLGGAWPGWRTVLLAALYSAGAHGIMTLNDFKAREGDAVMGIRSLPTRLGPERAAVVACLFMVAAQAVVVAVLAGWGLDGAGMVVSALILAQLPLMAWFLARPVERALHLSAFGVPLYVSGMMVSAFALGGVST